MSYHDMDLSSCEDHRETRLYVLREQMQNAREHGYSDLAQQIEETIAAIEKDARRRWWQFWK